MLIFVTKKSLTFFKIMTGRRKAPQLHDRGDVFHIRYRTDFLNKQNTQKVPKHMYEVAFVLKLTLAILVFYSLLLIGAVLFFHPKNADYGNDPIAVPDCFIDLDDDGLDNVKEEDVTYYSLDGKIIDPKSINKKYKQSAYCDGLLQDGGDKLSNCGGVIWNDQPEKRYSSNEHMTEHFKIEVITRKSIEQGWKTIEQDFKSSERNTDGSYNDFDRINGLMRSEYQHSDPTNKDDTQQQMEKGSKVISARSGEYIYIVQKGTQGSHAEDYEKFMKHMEVKLTQASEKIKTDKFQEALDILDGLHSGLLDVNDQLRHVILHSHIQALDAVGQETKNEKLLHKALSYCSKLLISKTLIDSIRRDAGIQCGDIQAKLKMYPAALATYKNVVKNFPEEIRLYNKIGLVCMSAGWFDKGKQYFGKVLQKYPNDPIASAYWGIILQIIDKNLDDAIPFLEYGYKSKELGEATQVVLTYLAEAHYRAGNQKKAYDLYAEAQQKGFYPSIKQRPRMFLRGIKSQPWWSMKETGYEAKLKKIENQVDTIEEELADILNGEDELDWFSLPEYIDVGDKKVLILFSKGQKHETNCKLLKQTCTIVSKFAAAAKCTHCTTQIVQITGGTHVWPFTGYTNSVLTADLGFYAPESAKIRVENKTRSWIEGQFIIYDDSFEHEIWTTYVHSDVFLLSIQMWHPGLSNKIKKSL